MDGDREFGIQTLSVIIGKEKVSKLRMGDCRLKNLFLPHAHSITFIIPRYYYIFSRKNFEKKKKKIVLRLNAVGVNS